MEPDRSKYSSLTESQRESGNTNFEADLAELVSRFSDQSGGGLGRELSAELALEVVLNQIVETACRTTGATGAAIVLERDGEMVCRASSGSTAPELGSRLELLSGLSGECLRTGRTQWSDDALCDPRADAEASQRLGVRSVIVMPLLRDYQLAGIFELFSTQPYAFGVRDERVLESLAEQTLASLISAAKALEPAPAPPPPPAPPTPRPVVRVEQEIPAPKYVEPKYVEPKYVEPDRTPAWLEPAEPAPLNRPVEPKKLHHQVDMLTWGLVAAIVGSSVLVGVLLGRRLDSPVIKDAQAATQPIPQTPAPKEVKKAEAPVKTPATKSSQWVATPPGGLLVFDRGKEVFRMAPGQKPQATEESHQSLQPASEVEPESVVDVPQETAERELIRRVEPSYPEAAREQNIEGEVVLEVHIGTDGAVQDVQVVSGNPLLTQASSEAVRQWRFRVKYIDGRAVEMQTRITLNFRLPAQALLDQPQ